MKLPSLIGISLLAVLFVGCAPEKSPGAGRPNILLITVDTLRRDHLQPYGYGRNTSSALAAFAEGAVVFEDAQAQAPWTLPSLASLMTGLETSAHGCRTFYDALAPSYETLAERLFEVGYDTAAVASHVFLGRDYGLDQGFVHFDDELVLEMARSDEVISSPKITAKAIKMIEAQAESKRAGATQRPFMLWLHYFDPHAQYLVHPGISGAFGTKRPLDLYDGEIAFTDRAIGRVLKSLSASGLDENTIVIITADHGEEFKDHNSMGHGRTLHFEALDIPLMVRAPGIPPRRVPGMVRSLDIGNTLFDLLDMPPFKEGSGVSLVPLMRGDPLDIPASLAELERNPRLSALAFVTSSTKILRAAGSDQWIRYDRIKDPAERAPQPTPSPEDLEARLWTARRIANQHTDSWRLTLGASELDDLAETGYAGDE